MKIQDLFVKLEGAYRLENLNEISSLIISLYKNKQIALLRQIHALIYNGNQGAEDRISRIFSMIITQYHPDRMEQINKDLKELLRRNDFEGMKKLDHILAVQKLDLSVTDNEIRSDADFEYGDIWDESASGFSYIDDEVYDREEYDPYVDMIMNHDFISAVKRKVYGHLNVEFPIHLLADMEIIEMANYEIENLDGVEYCTYARIIDLSSNNLMDITLLSQLLRLEEVFLQNNHISYLDGLNDLPYLRVLDLSHNDVDDLSALFEIETLEFINVIGNRIPRWQLEHLSMAGVIVVA